MLSNSRDDIYSAAGSRYAPSAPLATLTDHLDQPGRFALVAKPCDIAATRALGKHDSRVAEKILVMISFFCAGIPSTNGSRAILQKLGAKEVDVARFRYRGDGWPGRASAIMNDGQEKSMGYSASWGDILSKHVQFRCKICPDGSGGFADIVCADAWHSDENGYPQFEEEDGRSLIVSRTKRGEEHVSAAIAVGFLTTTKLDVDEIEKMQPSQAHRRRMVLSRLAAMAISGKSTPRFRGYSLMRNAMCGGLWLNARNFLGMLRRLTSSHH